jgi:glycosyltransferase involved in cell wall biosynthesis
MIENESAAVAALHRRGVLIVEQGGRGGVADYTRALAAGLARRGLPVTVATAEDHLYGSVPGARIVTVFAYVRGHSRTARLVRRVGVGPVANGLRFLASLPALLALARRHAVVHVQGWEAVSLGIIAMVLLRASGARLVYTAHNTFDRSAGWLDSARIMPALSRQTIVHTEADRGRVSPPPAVIPHGHYRHLADGVPTVDPAEARAALGLCPDGLVVLLFGVLRPDKGINDLLEAALDAPAWHILIAGEDHGGVADARQRLHSPQLVGRISVLAGFQPADQVARLFAAADLVALPYGRASQSGVLHLAYGFARPVVAYPVGGLAEAVIPGVTGWMCTEPSPRALAAVLHEAGGVGRVQLRRLGEEGRRWAERTFDWDAIAEATVAVYVSALVPGALTAGDAAAIGGADEPPPRAEEEAARR